MEPTATPRRKVVGDRVRPPCDHHGGTRSGHPDRRRAGGTTTNQHRSTATIDDRLDEARTAAIDAGADFVAATGLAALLDRYRFPTEFEEPDVAVPDVAGITEHVERRATEALLAADRAYRIAETLDDEDDPGFADLTAAAADAAAAAGGLRTDVRALGTLLLGVTSQQSESDAVHLIEHAVSLEVAARCEDTRLGDDLPVPSATTEDELVTEIAGYACRLLCEQHDRRVSTIRLTAPADTGSALLRDGILEISGDEGQIEVTITGEALLDQDAFIAALALAGWEYLAVDTDALEQGTVDIDTLFVAPVTVSEVAHLVVRTLVDILGATDITAVDRLFGVRRRH